MSTKTQKVNRFIDGFIAALKKAGDSDLFFGIFLILEGLSLMIAPPIFVVFVVISILIVFAFAIEIFFDIIRHRRTVQSKIQQICFIAILIVLAIYGILMLIDGKFRLNVDRLIVCGTTIADGIKNLIHSVKIEKRLIPRIIMIIMCLICINYGVVYLFLGGTDAITFTTTMHGVIFIFCGIINLWLFQQDPLKKRLEKSSKKQISDFFGI